MDRVTRRHRLPRKAIHSVGRTNLLKYRWPGNVRELSHELERAVVFEENEELKFEKLLAPNEAPLPAATGAPPSVTAFDSSEWFNERFTFPTEGFQLEEAINRLIQHALNKLAITFPRQRGSWASLETTFVTGFRARKSSPLLLGAVPR